MGATRTQVYFPDDQRRRLDAVAAERGVPMALVVREAVGEYLARRPDAAMALRASFGALPRLEVPDRQEWDRGRAAEPRAPRERGEASRARRRMRP